MKRPV